jgi:hypothetical protein
LFIQTIFSFKDSFTFISLFYSYLILENIKDPCNSSNISSSLRIIYIYFIVILLVAIEQHIFSKSYPFWYQQHWNCTWTHVFSYVPFCHQFFHLPLKFLCLLRVTLIGWPIRYTCSRYKINLVFNSPNRWQPTRNLFRKDVLKIL